MTNHDRNPQQLYAGLLNAYHAGNVNEFISQASRVMSRPLPFISELRGIVKGCLEKYGGLLSPESVHALQLSDDPVIAGHIADFSPSPPEPVIGKMPFPVTGGMGSVRSIHVRNGGLDKLSYERSKMLETTGVAVFSTLDRCYGKMAFWDPTEYCFSVLDHTDREDDTVSGHSMSLSLALCLYSLVTQMPVPVEWSATAEVGKDGGIHPVQGLKKKMEALKRERHFVKKVLISAKQAVSKVPDGIEFVFVDTLDEAIKHVFPSPIDPCRLLAAVDLDEEIKRIIKLYSTNQPHACIANADRLIRYLGSETCRCSKQKKIQNLFFCYWRKGSSLCHLGLVDGALSCLKTAENLFQKNPKLFAEQQYLDMLNNLSVSLKDVFLYQAAESINFKIRDRLEEIGAKDHDKGKNLSSLSQLYGALQRFDKAVDFQKRAIQMINPGEKHRNIGYLGWIYTRMGNYKSAAVQFKQEAGLIEKVDPKTRDKDERYYHWYLAEYLYRSLPHKKKPETNLKKLAELTEKNQNIKDYVKALVHKYYGLALLWRTGEESEPLEKGLLFLTSKNNPMDLIAATSIRAEKAVFYLQSTNWDQLVVELNEIIFDFKKQQKDIKRHFRAECAGISNVLKAKSRGKKAEKQIAGILAELIKKIPY